ncbi:hypothetical protein FHE66_05260 [Georgenia sp. 311]|uniref:SRPBCC family protein n=1 Tax=Georgenia wutianyii TaxID=2585135 RepID=A0ABX5VN58_9MICO|nr:MULTISPECIES: SRPBCC family protein [Georgenia]QDB78260.1 hypothetical protein FE251_01870 [Georgenia wutianyii]TNC18790.1 hypothetical protein FHE66_05260 [Georgenia sp. 311]
MASRVLDVPPDRAFRLVATLGRHDRWIPLTHVAAPPGPARTGDVVLARTAGVFVDRMQVARADPPHELVLRKLGPVLLGTSTITVSPAAGGRSRVTWTYDAHLRGPVPAPGVLNPVLEAMAAVAMWRMARWVRRTRPAG